MKNKEEWTSDPREIERRMIQAGMLKQALIWGPKGMKTSTPPKQKKTRQ